jgi:hypothetical protein
MYKWVGIKIEIIVLGTTLLTKNSSGCIAIEPKGEGSLNW